MHTKISVYCGARRGAQVLHDITLDLSVIDARFPLGTRGVMPKQLGGSIHICKWTIIYRYIQYRYTYGYCLWSLMAYLEFVFVWELNTTSKLLHRLYAHNSASDFDKTIVISGMGTLIQFDVCY